MQVGTSEFGNFVHSWINWIYMHFLPVFEKNCINRNILRKIFLCPSILNFLIDIFF